MTVLRTVRVAAIQATPEILDADERDVLADLLRKLILGLSGK